MARSRIEVNYRRLLDEVEATLQDSSAIADFSAQLDDVPSLIQQIGRQGAGGGQMVFWVDQSGKLLSQNAAAARRLGLELGMNVTDLALTPQSAQYFFDQQNRSRRPVPLSIVAPLGQTVFFLGRRTEEGGPIVLSEVRRGIDAEVRSRLAAAIGLIPSEAQLLAGLMEGQTIERIAADLGRKESTTRQQVKSIMAKMGVNSQVQMISTAYALARMYSQSLAVSEGSPEAQVTGAGAKLFEGRHGTLGLHQIGLDDGMPVLMVHGALFGISAGNSLQETAEAMGLRLIATERPGFGNTLLPEGVDPVALWCAQTIDLLDQMGIARAVVLAHDIGTRFAARLALNAPERVAAVVCGSTTPPMQSWSQTADMPARHRVNAWAAQNLPGLMDKIVALGLSQVARNGIEVVPKLVFDGCEFDQAVVSSPSASASIQEGFHLAWAQQGLGFRSDMRLTNENWHNEASQIAVPFFCFHGANNRTVSRKAVEDLARALPKGKFLVVEDAGHSLPVSHPKMLLRAVVAAGHAFGLGLAELGL